jgi:O-antigen/teichoic acid export membrane protein
MMINYLWTDNFMHDLGLRRDDGEPFPRKRFLYIPLFMSLMLSYATPARASEACEIFFRGTDPLIKEQLSLDPTTSFVDLQRARVAVIQNNLWQPGPELSLLKEKVTQGMGLVLILGPDTPPDSIAVMTDGAVVQTGIVKLPSAGSADALEQRAAIIHYVGPSPDPLGRWITWHSATRVHERTIVELKHARVLVATTRADRMSPSAPVLLRLRLGNGLVYIFTPWLQEGDQALRRASYSALLFGESNATNYDLQRWPYFNYLWYYLSRDAARMRPVDYSSWAAAPIPGGRDAVTVGIVSLLLLLVAAGIFSYVRRYSLAHPERLAHFSVSENPQADFSIDGTELHPGSSLIGKTDPRWEMAGFHRALSGFLYNFILSVGIMMPLGLIVTFYVQLNYVNPFVEARGEWTIVGQFMQVFFVILDLGTTQAMVKYFAEYRISDFKRAITYIQLAIWFHALVGILEIGVLGLFACIVMPKTSLAFLSWIVILHSVIQFPGLVLIFRDLFRALQRYDFSIFLILVDFLVNPVAQIACAIYGRHWGLSHPVFGEGLGVVFGFAVGSFVSHSLLIGISALFYRGVGLRLSTIFLAHFDRSSVTQALGYGLRLSVGRAIAAFSTAAVPLLLVRGLDDFLELNELFVIVYSLTFGYLEASAFIFSSVMPSISESMAAGKLALTRRYMDQSLRWGSLILALLGGAFVAFSDILIRGLLPHQFARALDVLLLMHIWRIIDFTARLPDEVLQASGRTGLLSWSLVIEHASRVAMLPLLLGEFRFPGLFYAFVAGSVIRSIVSWRLMIRHVIRPVVSWWQTTVSPVVTGLVNYALLRVIVVTLWAGPGHYFNTAATVVVALLCSLPISMFVSGLLGWDDNSLQEFRDAAALVPAPFDSIARMALRILLLGSRVSPFENQFPAKLAVEAAAEAKIIGAAESNPH